jgi:hypothetical protein
MKIGDRLSDYEARGFDEKDAIVNVLLEVALHSLFVAFPTTFVCFGGATLVIFFGSSRVSSDHLLVGNDSIPGTDEILAALSVPLTEAAKLLRISPPEFSVIRSGPDLHKLLVNSAGERLFTIDVTRISGVIHSELIEAPLVLDATPTVKARIVTRNWMLLQKAEAFLTRRMLKTRDAFDIKLLLDTGAALNETLAANLSDGRASERLEDRDFIAHRIEQVSAKQCELELRPVLPNEVYRDLATQDFEPLRAALGVLFAEWLN